MNAWDIKREAAIPVWQERIRECRSSGMSAGQWCDMNGISRKTYYRWEKLCIARAMQGGQSEGEASRSLIRINPERLPSGISGANNSESSAPAELTIRFGCVSMDISSEMPVSKIAELVSALNQHV